MSNRSANAASPAKVLRLITRMNIGGPALHVLTLAEGLGGFGYEHVLASGTCQPEEGDTDAPVPAGQEVLVLPTLSRSIAPVKDIAAIWAAYRLMRRERPLIVHTHTAKAGIVGRIAAYLAGVPLIVHTFHGNSLTGYFSPAASACFQVIERVLVCITDQICVVSEQQRAELSGLLRLRNLEIITVVPLGLDLSSELRCPPPPVHRDVLTVGWLGRLVDVKGVPLLISIIEEAVRRNAAVRFLVGGGGPRETLLRDAVSRYGAERVQWTGWRRDIPEFLADCDLLIQTSINEGTPVALIQGMAAGRPFIATPVGGVVDLVDGQVRRAESGCRWYANGVLSDPDPAAFVNALEHMQRNRACLHSMGAAGRTLAAERFQAERLVRDMDLLYRELRKRHTSAAQRTAEKQTARMTIGEM